MMQMMFKSSVIAERDSGTKFTRTTASPEILPLTMWFGFMKVPKKIVEKYFSFSNIVRFPFRISICVSIICEKCTDVKRVRYSVSACMRQSEKQILIKYEG